MTMRSDVSICILSGPEPPTVHCYWGVTLQGDYPVYEIKNLAPMSVAFNAMVSKATTPYIVQVDGDVALEPGAVDRLSSSLRALPPYYYMTWGQLYEEGFGRGGAVRCWKRWPLTLCKFRDVRCVDRDLHRRIRRFGMRRFQVPNPEPFGVHSPRTTPFARYSKTKGDVQKWKFLGREDLLLEHLEAYAEADHARAGCLIGLIQSPTKSKNLQRDWAEFEALFTETP